MIAQAANEDDQLENHPGFNGIYLRAVSWQELEHRRILKSKSDRTKEKRSPVASSAAEVEIELKNLSV